MSDVEDVAEAWRVAAEDLGIRVTVPFVLDDRIEAIALVHEFGGPAGTLIMTMDEDLWQLERVTRPLGYFVSLLNPASYRQYARQLFIDTLDDWGYFGTGAPPDWYSGQPGTP